MVPLPVVDLLVEGACLGSARAHVQQEVQVALQHLDGEEVHPERLRVLGPFDGLLGLPVAEEQQPVGLGGAEVERDRARLLGVPLVQGDEGLGRFEGDGVEGRHVLALEGHHAVDLHLGVPLLRHPGELQTHIVVFVHDLWWQRRRCCLARDTLLNRCDASYMLR